jgi:arabinan endo-1,5-alpha-L-arabinosidase
MTGPIGKVSMLRLPLLLRRGAGLLVVFMLAFGVFGAVPATITEVAAQAAVYQNPLPVTIPGDGMVESCADPAIIRGQEPGDSYWYMYCTTDPLNDEDRNENGGFNFRLIPILRSLDLVNWEYVGVAFEERPDWIANDAGMWAPDIQYFNGQYYLYYTASWTDLPGGGSAIGVATSDSPTGPFVDAGAPVVEPHAPPCCPFDKRWVFDSSVVQDPLTGQRYIYYGSYFGGISVRELSEDGLTSDPATQVEVAIGNRYEGAYVVYKDGYYYLFVSATDCCRGPLTGYSVFVGRSTSPTGPFVDREGNSFLAGPVGGTPVLTMNGNRWVGPGHNAVFQDAAGQWWTVYHAIDVNDPYFEGAVGFTKRPVLLDPLVWMDGWPVVRGGLFASDSPQPVPAAQPGDPSRLRLEPLKLDVPGMLMVEYSDEFNQDVIGSQWTWVREPAEGTARVEEGHLVFPTQAADLFVDSNNASVLLQDAPDGPYLVEARVKIDFPLEGCCFNYVQAGLVIYGDDDNFIKLVPVSIWETRQTEFAKEVALVPPGYPRYGNTVVGAPAEWTYIRIAVRNVAGETHFTAYTSQDGERWVRGGTWTHDLGPDESIGLVAMGGSGFTAYFDYVRVYRLNQEVIQQ